MQIKCDDCGAVYKIPDDKISKGTNRASCRRCGAKIVIRRTDHVMAVHEEGSMDRQHCDLDESENIINHEDTTVIADVPELQEYNATPPLTSESVTTGDLFHKLLGIEPPTAKLTAPASSVAAPAATNSGRSKKKTAQLAAMKSTKKASGVANSDLLTPSPALNATHPEPEILAEPHEAEAAPEVQQDAFQHTAGTYALSKKGSQRIVETTRQEPSRKRSASEIRGGQLRASPAPVDPAKSGVSPSRKQESAGMVTQSIGTSTARTLTNADCSVAYSAMGKARDKVYPEGTPPDHGSFFSRKELGFLIVTIMGILVILFDSVLV